MAGRLVDYIGQGLATNLPTAATVDGDLTAGAHAFYYATDTEVLYNLDRTGTPSWKALSTGGGSGLASGTVFPGSPSTNDRFKRTDLNMVFFFDGTRWLSEEIFTVETTPAASLLPLSNSLAGFQRAVNPWSGVYDLYVEDLTASYFISGTGNWDITFTENQAGANTDLHTFSGFSVSNTWTNLRHGHDAVIDSAVTSFEIAATENSGTSSLFLMCSITYRIVAS